MSHQGLDRANNRWEPERQEVCVVTMTWGVKGVSWYVGVLIKERERKWTDLRWVRNTEVILQ